MKQWLSMMLVVMMVLVMAPYSSAVSIIFTADLDGPSEEPAVLSPGTGEALVVYDSVAHTLSITTNFQDLIGTTTVAHIHCCTDIPEAGLIGVAVTPGTLPGFPVGVTSGSYTTVLDLTAAGTYTGGSAGFIARSAGGILENAEEALIEGLLDGRAYFNIHSTFRPGGEIRGFLHAVPEPGTFGLLAAGIVALCMAVRRRRTQLL
ncbi:MAG: CHRD domain-containing protein [Candidatus Tectimicrobiota bacterium]